MVEVSEENGWRKPSAQIFQGALIRLQVGADEAVYVGDSPLEDIKGAKQAGLRTVFVPSQFNTIKDLLDSQQQPDYLAKDLGNNLPKPPSDSFLIEHLIPYIREGRFVRP